jgi:hypothetical protein
MKYKMLGKGLAVAVIILFIGVGVQPAFAELSEIKENYLQDDFDIDNSNCFIIGRIKENCLFFPFFSIYLKSDDLAPYFEPLLISFLIIPYLSNIVLPFRPHFNSVVLLGDKDDLSGVHEARGWVYTVGDGGTQEIQGKFLGRLGKIDWFSSNPMVFDYKFYIGVEGFTGIRIFNIITGVMWFFGHAKRVSLEKVW